MKNRKAWVVAGVLSVVLLGSIPLLVLRLKPYWIARYRGRKAALRGAVLTRAPLRGADLIEADLRSAVLTGAQLQGADLSGANLREANLEGANLQGAELHATELQGANLRRAVLRHVQASPDLRGADLSHADLRSASLAQANFGAPTCLMWTSGSLNSWTETSWAPVCAMRVSKARFSAP
jgi:uncharacterized protein YjbI with pentapeptide repeats